jgi:hypothetical protein
MGHFRNVCLAVKRGSAHPASLDNPAGGSAAEHDNQGLQVGYNSGSIETRIYAPGKCPLPP